MKTKQEIRREILAMRQKLQPGEIRQRSEKIASHVIRHPAFEAARNLCIYMPIRQEADPTLLIKWARQGWKAVWVPKVVGDEMVFNAYDPACMQETEPYHILESTSDEILQADADTLIIMPGAVFDRQGNRIGYGGGYYDKYLATHPLAQTLAICYDFQIVSALPAEAHDIRPRWIVSENGVLE